MQRCKSLYTFRVRSVPHTQAAAGSSNFAAVRLLACGCVRQRRRHVINICPIMIRISRLALPQRGALAYPFNKLARRSIISLSSFRKMSSDAPAVTEKALLVTNWVCPYVQRIWIAMHFKQVRGL